MALTALSVLATALSLGCNVGSNNPSSTGPVVLSESQSQVRIGQTVQFTATQDGTALSTGDWQVSGGSSNGTIDSTGLYRSPAVVPSQNQIAVTDTVDGNSYTSSLTLLNPLPVVQTSSVAALTATSAQVVFGGTGFTSGTVIDVNGSAAATTYISSSQVSALVGVPLGTTGSIAITATNPAPGGATSAALSLPVHLPTFTVTPAVLTGGQVTLSITGGPAYDGNVVILLNGKALPTTSPSAGVLQATGYLPPWKAGTATVGVAPASGMPAVEQVTLPIAATAVSYDTASRFATQAAFGPREDVIEHIQQIGLAPFIAEQLQQPALTHDPNGLGSRKDFLQNAIVGNSLLRERVAWALQTFVVDGPGTVDLKVLEPWQHKMETDAFGNYRQLLEDAASDPTMGAFLSLNNNIGTLPDPTIHPNQNFSRELMQLFSMGDVMLNPDGTVQVGSNGQPIPSYDQTTVINLSRVFTGWELPMETPQSDPNYVYAQEDYAAPLYAREWEHDEGQKVIFGNVTIPAGQTTAADREMALDAIFNHPNVPPFVSRILIQRLVKSNPSPAYIGRISAVFADDGTGVRGNMSAVVTAILLDPEARAGDTAPSASDGYLQEPLLWQAYGMSMLGMANTDGEPTYIPGELGEDFMNAPTVFGFYGPNDTIPGTKILSPEFALLNNQSLIQRSQLWWAMIQGQGIQGFWRQPNYLYSTFTNVPDFVDALNHMLYHGQMSAAEQTTILNYCQGMDPANLQAQFDIALFLAGNADSYNVSH